MRGYYLRKSHDQGGCRGGVGNNYEDSNDYELEIGAKCYASPEMIALCVLYDEIIEYLPKSSIGELILNKHKELTDRIIHGMTSI